MKKIDKINGWTIEKDGSMVHDSGYYIEGYRLNEGNWLTHMAAKNWVDMKEFTRAYFYACQVRGITEVNLRTDYMF